MGNCCPGGEKNKSNTTEYIEKQPLVNKSIVGYGSNNSNKEQELTNKIFNEELKEKIEKKYDVMDKNKNKTNETKTIVISVYNDYEQKKILNKFNEKIKRKLKEGNKNKSKIEEKSVNKNLIDKENIIKDEKDIVGNEDKEFDNANSSEEEDNNGEGFFPTIEWGGDNDDLLNIVFNNEDNDVLEEKELVKKGKDYFEIVRPRFEDKIIALMHGFCFNKWSRNPDGDFESFADNMLENMQRGEEGIEIKMRASFNYELAINSNGEIESDNVEAAKRQIDFIVEFAGFCAFFLPNVKQSWDLTAYYMAFPQLKEDVLSKWKTGLGENFPLPAPFTQKLEQKNNEQEIEQDETIFGFAVNLVKDENETAVRIIFEKDGYKKFERWLDDECLLYYLLNCLKKLKDVKQNDSIKIKPIFSNPEECDKEGKEIGCNAFLTALVADILHEYKKVSWKLESTYAFDIVNTFQPSKEKEIIVTTKEKEINDLFKKKFDEALKEIEQKKLPQKSKVSVANNGSNSDKKKSKKMPNLFEELKKLEEKQKSKVEEFRKAPLENIIINPRSELADYEKQEIYRHFSFKAAQFFNKNKEENSYKNIEEKIEKNKKNVFKKENTKEEKELKEMLNKVKKNNLNVSNNALFTNNNKDKKNEDESKNELHLY